MPDSRFIVGLTGGIASGKSTIAGFFEDLGAAVIDTDIVAREVVAPGSPGLEEVRMACGDDVIADDGSLDRRKMRDIIFADDEKRRALEAILHPRIRTETWRQATEAEGAYVVIVVPLLYESPMKAEMDRIVVSGGARLRGEVAVSGSKNATLALMAGALLADSETVLHNVPRLRDVDGMLELMRALGARAEMDEVEVVGRAVGCAIGRHRRDRDPVGERHLAQPIGREHRCVCGVLRLAGRARREPALRALEPRLVAVWRNKKTQTDGQFGQGRESLYQGRMTQLSVLDRKRSF